MSLFANLATPVELVIILTDDHVKIRLISPLINGILRVLQKLLKCFNGTIVSKTFVLPLTWVFPVICALDLNDLDPASMRHCSNVSSRSHIGRDVADHTEMLSWCCN